MVNRSLLILALVATAGLLQAGTTEARDLGRALLQVNITDADILNFALQLEYLEANFYSFSVYGVGLNETQRGGGPEAVGGKMAELSPAMMKVALEIANDEIRHVDLLRGALGDAAVPQPEINIGTAFAAAANAAAGTTLTPAFDPYLNDLFWLHGAFLFEDVGVSAYAGAAALIADPDTLTAAAGILGVEAYHGGIIRTMLAPSRNVILPYGVRVKNFLQLIANILKKVSGVKAQGIVNLMTGFTNLVPTDGSGLVYDRTPPQVLDIVYLGSSEKVGGFFPMGISGVFGPK